MTDTLPGEGEWLTFLEQRAQFDFSWLVVDQGDMPFTVSPLKIGPDVFDHVIINRPSNKPPYYVPHVNVNPSQALRWKAGPLDRDTLRSGLYQVVVGYHHYGAVDEVPAFFIMRHGPKPLRFRTMREAYDSKNRGGLPSIEGQDPADYINVHPASRADSASLGCFTVPEAVFTAFRKHFKDLEVGLMLFSRPSNPLIKAKLQEELDA